MPRVRDSTAELDARASSSRRLPAMILLGAGGIEPGSVLIRSDEPDNDAHFSFSSAAVNGVAFWDLGRGAR